MVRRGDFEISLVQADTKKPFKEHITKDGQVYVEVEPDEEYFIRVQRVGNSFPCTLLVDASVDDKNIGYSTTFSPTAPFLSFIGLMTHNNGTSTLTALKFTKPRPVHSGRQHGKKQQHSGLLMGKVDIGIYQGLSCGYGVADNFQFSWQGDQSRVPAAAKKCLRSAAGTSSFTTTFNNQYPFEHYMHGRMIGMVTLNYCAALGLIQVGVLPRPSPEVYRRMVNQYTRGGSCYPDTTASSRTSHPLPIITPIRMKTFCGKEEVLYDLTNLNDDDDE